MTERNDEHCCFICGQPFKAGEMVLHDVTEGLGHRACFGEDREGYVHLDTGNPLVGDDPLPTGFPYDPAEFADPAPTERKISSERVSEERALSAMIYWVKAALQCKQWIWDGDQRGAAEFDLAEAEKALLALRSSVKTVRVKSLEWHRSEIIGWNGDWHTVPTAYSIRCADENGWKWSGFGGFGYERSDESAKAAAQADYERRILSAIEAPAAANEVTDSMVQKAWEAYDAKSGYSKPERFRAALTAALKGDRS